MKWDHTYSRQKGIRNLMSLINAGLHNKLCLVNKCRCTFCSDQKIFWSLTSLVTKCDNLFKKSKECKIKQCTHTLQIGFVVTCYYYRSYERNNRQLTVNKSSNSIVLNRHSSFSIFIFYCR